MAMTFDATLKDLGRDCPQGVLAEFDQPPQAAHPNTDGRVSYAPRPGRGRMHFEYEIVRLWERPAERLLAGELGLAPLAVLGNLPKAAVVHRLVHRLTSEAQPEKAAKLLTTALLLTGLRVSRNAALKIFRGVPCWKNPTPT